MNVRNKEFPGWDLSRKTGFYIGLAEIVQKVFVCEHFLHLQYPESLIP
jgi:hypothetical protein